MGTKNRTPETTEKILINDYSTFEEWTVSLQKFKSKNGKNYSFNLPELSFYENLKVTTEVDYYSAVCGSRLKNILMKFTFLIMVAYFFISGGTFSEITIYHLLICAGSMLFAALVGKTLSFLHAQWHLHQIARVVEKRMNGVYSEETAHQLLQNY